MKDSSPNTVPQHFPSAVMDYSTLSVIGHVAREALDGSRLRRVVGAKSGDVIFEFDIIPSEKPPSEFTRWIFSADTALFRAHPFLGDIPDRSEQNHLIEVCSHHIGGAKVTNIEVADFERVLTIHFRRRDYAGNDAEYRFIAELMGKYSNLILVDQSGVILASQKSVHSYQSRAREIRAGKEYTPPPAQDRITPREFDPDEWGKFIDSAVMTDGIRRHLAITFAGMSLNWADSVCLMAQVDPDSIPSSLDPDSRERLRSAFIQSLTHIKNGEPLTGEDRYSFVQRVATELTSRADKAALDKEKQRIQVIVDRRKKKLDSLSHALNDDLGKADKANEYKKKADLLVANIYKIQPGMTSLDVDDWSTGQSVKLDLDPQTTPQIQAERQYSRYRKLKRTNEVARVRLNAVESESGELESIVSTLKAAASSDEIRDIHDQLIIRGLVIPEQAAKSEGRKKQKTKRDQDRAGAAGRPGERSELSVNRYRSNDGFLIIAGKGERSNDLLRRTSRPDDMWLHVRDIPGSHVYILAHGKEVPETTIREAAMVAAWHSKAQASSNVPVDYTRAKYVTPIPGSGPGHVRFKREHTIRVTPDENRIEKMRLMAGDVV
jgi:predicted ribosome quality control (RQC) complex YloA/Tae2 family protein